MGSSWRSLRRRFFSDNLYVQSLSVQGKDTWSSWLPIELLADGTNVELTMGPVPNEDFGANPMERSLRFYP